MAAGEVTGADEDELQQLRLDFLDTPIEEAGVAFETAYCLHKIGKQPEEYDGPTRWCKRRAAKLTDDEWAEEYDDEKTRKDARAFHPSCQFHGRGHGSEATLPDDRGFANLKHGMYATDRRLREDFSEADEKLYEEILEWAEIYDFPTREEDPARWKLLEKLAINEVRSVRGYLYLYDEGEVQLKDIYDEQGVVVGEEPEENALSKEYRLLQSTLIDIMRELGVTPKERSKMSSQETEASAADTLAKVAEEALSQDNDYDPDEFEG